MPSFRERFNNHPGPSPADASQTANDYMEENAMQEAAMQEADMYASMDNGTMEAPSEGFANLNMGRFPVDLVLKAIFFGAIFYLLSLPEVYKMTKKCCKGVDGVLLHSVVFAILYFVLSQFIN